MSIKSLISFIIFESSWNVKNFMLERENLCVTVVAEERWNNKIE